MTKSDFDKLYNLEVAKSLSEPDQRIELDMSVLDATSTRGANKILAQLLIRNLIYNLSGKGDYIQVGNFKFDISPSSLKTLDLELLIGNNDF